MVVRFGLTIFFVIITSIICFAQGEEYLPASFNEWKAVDSIQKYAGEDLFILIDGGADIFYEYGFVDVVTQKYSRGEDVISTEIYVMQDSGAAFGIFSLKAVGSGKKISIGSGASGSDDFIMFWKNKYFITLSVYNGNKASQDGLREIARGIDSLILDSQGTPALVDLLNKEESINSNIVYIKGNMGLYNLYYFDSANIFGIKEGAAANLNNTEIFIFKYDSPEECSSWFLNAVNKIRGNPKYKKIKLQDETMFLKLEDFISMNYLNRYIIISVSDNKDQARQTMFKLKGIIEKSI